MRHPLLSRRPVRRAAGSRSQARSPLVPTLLGPALGPALVLAAGLLAGCQSDSLRPRVGPPPDQLYWDLNLNHHGVLMSTIAPYDTLTLTAMPRNYQGVALAGLPTPTYQSSDPGLLRVTPDGVLHAVRATNVAQNGVVTVTATLSAGGITHQDATVVEVVDTAPSQKLATFSIHPVLPDSAKTAATGDAGSDVRFLFEYFLTGQVNFVTAHAVDSAGVPMTHLPVAYRFSNSGAALVSLSYNPDVPRDSILPLGKYPGTATIYASITAFGIRKADTLPFQIKPPLVNRVMALGGTFDVPEVKIGTGGFVIWTTDPLAPDTVEVAFADPTAVASAVAPTPDSASTGGYFALCLPFSPVITQWVLNQAGSNGHAAQSVNTLNCTGQGNFTLPPGPATNFLNPDGSVAYVYYPPSAASRRFPVPGTYEYVNTKTGARGRVVVSDN